MAAVSTVFVDKAHADAAALGLREPRIAPFLHPLGGISEAELAQRVDQLSTGLLAALDRPVGPALVAAEAAARRVPAPADPALLQVWMFERGWTEGFPVIPPTPEAVARFVVASGRAPEDVLGVIPPRHGVATVEQIAVNAVMAGCRPAHMPVLVAAVEAMLEPRFNLGAVQATTHPVAPLLVVHGPIARELGISGGAGCFGPGALANAVIGRAVRLILWNIGGAHPGTADRSTQGAPSKFSYCIAENTEASPWGPFHLQRGLAPEQNAVTVYPGEPPHNVNDHVHGDAESILCVAADVLRTLGTNTWYISWEGQKEMLLVLSPEHAASIAASGFGVRAVQEFLFRAVSRRRDELALGGMYSMRDWGPDMEALSAPDAVIPAVPRPEDILVLVAGGPGRHSAAIPSFGCALSVTRPITTR